MTPSEVTTSNVGELLASAAEQAPQRVVLSDLGSEASSARRELSAQQLDVIARCVAGALIAQGAQRGDAIALIAENTAELVSAWFGIAYAGCTVVPIPVFSAAPELTFRIAHARCTVVMFDRAREGLVREALAAIPLADGAPPVLLTLEEAVSTHYAPVQTLADTASSDTAMLLYTSGTTAHAKGAAISHGSLLTHTRGLTQHALGLSASDRVLGILPLTHSYGCRLVMLAGLCSGARIVLVPRFNAARTLELLQSEAITWAPVVPTMLAAWCAEPSAARPTALRWLLSAGAPLPDAIAERAEAKLGVEVRQGYGMTEATFSTINSPPDARVLGSVGRPAPGVQLRIVDANGDELPAGEDGEVLVSGPNVMTRYLHDEAASREALRDGFMHSGDVGHLDVDKRLWIVDRIKDLIIRGGHNVYPSEVEAALATHPSVHEVAVIGRPDAYYGEEVVAVVVRAKNLEVSAQELTAHAAARVGRTKVPREVAFIDAMPLGPSGKIQKRTLRAWLNEGRITLERAV